MNHKRIYKIITVFLLFIYMFSLSSTTIFGDSSKTQANIDTSKRTTKTNGSNEYNFVASDGNIIKSIIDFNNEGSIATTYINGIKAKYGIYDRKSDVITTYDIITDSNTETEIMQLTSQKTIKEILERDGNSTPEKLTGVNVAPSKKIRLSDASIQPNFTYFEPVDNTGLEPSVYGDGYYFITSANPLYWSPDTSGFLFRYYYVSNTDNVVNFWSYMGDEYQTILLMLGNILNNLTLENLFITVLDFGINMVLDYSQYGTSERATHYNQYRVRVNMDIQFIPYRSIRYWAAINNTTGTANYEQDTFLSGFSQGNLDMIRIGCENFLNN